MDISVKKQENLWINKQSSKSKAKSDLARRLVMTCLPRTIWAESMVIEPRQSCKAAYALSNSEINNLNSRWCGVTSFVTVRLLEDSQLLTDKISHAYRRIQAQLGSKEKIINTIKVQKRIGRWSGAYPRA